MVLTLLFQASSSKQDSRQPKQKTQECENNSEKCVHFSLCSCEPLLENVNQNQKCENILQQIVLQWPHIMIAFMFRWPDLLSELQLDMLCEQHNFPNKTFDKQFILKRLPYVPCSCLETNKIFQLSDTDWICCNPFHWSRIISDPFPIDQHVLTGNLLLLPSNFYYICYYAVSF